MHIQVELLCYNELPIIEATIRHYQCLMPSARIIVHDNFSTDGSPEVARYMGAEVRTFGSAGVLDDRAYLAIKNRLRPELDWRVVCDMDEVLHVSEPELAAYARQGVTAIAPDPWASYHERHPAGVWESLPFVGSPSGGKVVCYSPKMVGSMGYSFGAHSYSAPVVLSVKKHLYLHYKTGGAEYYADRREEFQARKCDFNNRHGLGIHYDTPRKETIKEWQAMVSRQKSIIL
jgi:hypothetical protein